MSGIRFDKQAAPRELGCKKGSLIVFNLRARAMRDVSLAALTQSAVTAFMAAMLPRTSSGSGCATSVLTPALHPDE
jgi:hypothetical protein